jgi:hypothetical protein
VYEPIVGRFLGVDQIVQLGSSQSPNAFAYVWNNPLTLTDPSGFVPVATECTRDEETGQCAEIGVTGSRIGGNWIEFDLQELLDLLGRRGGGVLGGAGDAVGGGAKQAPQRQQPERGDLHYFVEDFAFCEADSLFSQFSKPDSAAPGAPAATPGTTPDILLTGDNPITQIVDPAARTITNVTQDGHRYHSGTVEIRITPTWYGSSVSIEGRGTGPHYWENRLVGAALFSALAARATISCTFGAN